MCGCESVRLSVAVYVCKYANRYDYLDGPLCVCVCVCVCVCQFMGSCHRTWNTCFDTVQNEKARLYLWCVIVCVCVALCVRTHLIITGALNTTTIHNIAQRTCIQAHTALPTPTRVVGQGVALKGYTSHTHTHTHTESDQECSHALSHSSRASSHPHAFVQVRSGITQSREMLFM